jgi:hypothetical protein
VVEAWRPAGLASMAANMAWDSKLRAWFFRGRFCFSLVCKGKDHLTHSGSAPGRKSGLRSSFGHYVCDERVILSQLR